MHATILEGVSTGSLSFGIGFLEFWNRFPQMYTAACRRRHESSQEDDLKHWTMISPNASP